MRRSLALLVAVMLVGGLSTVALGAALPPGGTFYDDDGNPHEGNIEAIAAAGVTQGCAVGLYCPSSPVTRGQMASFLARAFSFPTATKDYFPDDNGSTHEANINRIAEAGVTTGYADGTYQPDGFITRAQMGSFIARAMGLTPIPGDRFADVSGPHEPNINAIADAGVTLGCNPEGTLYCPNNLVRRDRMASFIARALGLMPIIPPPPTSSTSSTSTSSTATLPPTNHPQSGDGWRFLDCSNDTGTCTYPQTASSATIDLGYPPLPPDYKLCLRWGLYGCEGGWQYISQWNLAWTDPSGSQVSYYSCTPYYDSGTALIAGRLCSVPIAGKPLGEYRGELCYKPYGSSTCTATLLTVYFEVTE